MKIIKQKMIAIIISSFFIFCNTFYAFSQTIDAKSRSRKENIQKANLLFRFPTGGIVTSGPDTNSNLVWLLSDSKEVYVLTIEGKAIGKRNIGYKNIKFLCADSFGRAAIVGKDFGLAILNQAGQEVWTHNPKSEILCKPIFAADNRLFLTTADKIYALTPNGKKIWEYKVDSVPSTQTTIGITGGPVIGLKDGNILLLAAGNEYSKKIKLNSSSKILAATKNVIVSVQENNSSFFLQDSKDNLSELEIRKQVNFDKAVLNVSTSSDTFYFLFADGTIKAIDENGIEKWQTVADHNALFIKAYQNRIVVTGKDFAQSFSTNGETVSTVYLQNAITFPIVAINGTILAGGSDWILYSYLFDKELIPFTIPPIKTINAEVLDNCVTEESKWSLENPDNQYLINRTEEIQKEISTGVIQNDSVIFLAALAAGSFSNADTNTREKACIELGNIGLPVAVPVLIDIAKNEKEEIIKAAAIEAIANIGMDIDGASFNAFLSICKPELTKRTSFAIINAIEKLYRSQGNLNNKTGLFVLIRISSGSYNNEIKRRANEAIDRIKKIQA